MIFKDINIMNKKRDVFLFLVLFLIDFSYFQ